MNTELNDPRRGFTSASNATYDRLCPGRHQAQKGLPDTESNDARLGTLIHKAYSGDGEAMASLSDADQRVVRRGLEIEAVILHKWQQEHGGVSEHHKNLRMWAHPGIDPVHSGEVDAIWLSADRCHALIGDLKSFWGDTPDATVNEQLRDYAALAFERYDLESVTVFINQPRVAWHPENVTVVRYDRLDLKQARAEMLERVAASTAPDAKRIPGQSQCKFCRAAGTNRCPESVTTMLTTANNLSGAPVWEGLTPKERGDLISELKRIEKLASDMLDAAKAKIMEDPAAVEGWAMSKPQEVRKVTDVMGVAQRLADTFPAFDAVKFAASCSITVGALEKFHKALDTEKRTHFGSLFDDYIERASRAPSLQKSNG